MSEEITISIAEPGPYGLKIKGGIDFGLPIIIAHVNPNGKGDLAGIRPNMKILSVNGRKFDNITHYEAALFIKNALFLTMELLDIPAPSPTSSFYINENKIPEKENEKNKIISENDSLKSAKHTWYKKFINQMDVKLINGKFQAQNIQSTKAETPQPKPPTSAPSQIDMEFVTAPESSVISECITYVKSPVLRNGCTHKQKSKNSTLNITKPKNGKSNILPVETKRIMDKYLGGMNNNGIKQSCTNSFEIPHLDRVANEDTNKTYTMQKGTDSNLENASSLSRGIIKCFNNEDTSCTGTFQSPNSLDAGVGNSDKNMFESHLFDNSTDYDIETHEPILSYESKLNETLQSLKDHLKDYGVKISEIPSDNKTNEGKLESTYNKADINSKTSDKKQIEEKYGKHNYSKIILDTNKTAFTGSDDKNFESTTRFKNLEPKIIDLNGVFHPCFIISAEKRKSKSSKELSILDNDCLHLLRKVNNDWYEAESSGHIGLFNISKVKIKNLYMPMKDIDHTIAIAVSTCNYNTRLTMFFTYKKDDYFIINESVDNEYFEATMNSDRGIVHKKHMQLMKPNYRVIFRSEEERYHKISLAKSNLASSNIPEANILFLCEAFQVYEPNQHDEIHLKIGDLIFVNKFYNDGWGYGYNDRLQTCGMFPTFICHHIIPIDNQ